VQIKQARGLAEIQELISSQDFPPMLARSKVAFYYLLGTTFHDRRFARNSEETARMIKDKFNIYSFLGYRAISIHLKTLIRVDMFEIFRNMCMKFYSLDISHGFTRRRFTLDCAFFFNRVRVQVVKDKRVKNLTENETLKSRQRNA